MKPLSGLKVLDFTQRLPGPLGGHLLALLGADVIKVEDQKYQDAFLQTEQTGLIGNFQDWYHELNKEKKLTRLNFDASDIKSQISQLMSDADIILTGMPQKLAIKLGLDHAGLKQINRALVVLEVGASKDNQGSMHDLNALAEAGFLQLHVTDNSPSPLAPPFLPVAGISFGQQIALTALAFHRQAQQEKKPIISKVYLYDEIIKVMGPLWSSNLRGQKQTKFLHNGAYPCYALYRNKDGDWLAVAAVEEKFWREFVNILNLPLSAEDRFSTSQKTFQHVVQAIQALSTAELEGLLASKEICVSLIKTTS
ncbi:MAG: CoA transferase [Bacteriovoracia bacterium]